MCHLVLKVDWHDILQSAGGNVTTFTTWLQVDFVSSTSQVIGLAASKID